VVGKAERRDITDVVRNFKYLISQRLEIARDISDVVDVI
jgi:hypothetical protein